MKNRISITLSEDLLKTIHQMMNESQNRSHFIEHLLREYLSQKARKDKNDRDLQILNSNSKRLNEEAMDTLEYQIGL